MSGSTRAITLAISVKDADQVLTTLRSIGPAGEQALERLEAAATKAQGRASGSGGSGVAGLRTIIGQAGFQIQDFAVQVQSGTSALTALSQQGSQLLGVFGPAGAIAGAALTVGLLAAQILGIGTNSQAAQRSAEAAFKGMAEAAEATANVIRDINELFRSSAENAAAAGNAYVAATRQAALAQQSIAVQQQEGATIELSQAQRELEQQRAAAARTLNRRIESLQGRQAASQGRLSEFMAPFEEQSRQDLFRAEARVQGLQHFIELQGARAGALGQQLERLNRFGTYDASLPAPPVPPSGGASAADNSAASAGASEARRAELQRQALAQAAFTSEARASADAIRDYESVLRTVETPMERYTRQVENLTELEDRLRESGTPMLPADYDRLISAYAKQLEDAQRNASGLNSAARELGMTFSSAFEDAIIKGKALSDVLQGVAEDLARIILRQAVINPLAGAASSAATAAGNYIGSLFGGGTVTGATYGAGGYTGAGPFTASAMGNAFSNGRLIPFANGGVVDRATVMPMALMGEAGPEAVMPLKRGKDGKLGIAGQSGGGGVTQHITIDARGADPSVVPMIRLAMAQAKREAKAELLNEIQRGGNAARVVGRRA